MTTVEEETGHGRQLGLEGVLDTGELANCGVIWPGGVKRTRLCERTAT